MDGWMDGLSKNIEGDHYGHYNNHCKIKNWVHGVLLSKIRSINPKEVQMMFPITSMNTIKLKLLNLLVIYYFWQMNNNAVSPCTYSMRAISL